MFVVIVKEILHYHCLFLVKKDFGYYYFGQDLLEVLIIIIIIMIIIITINILLRIIITINILILLLFLL